VGAGGGLDRRPKKREKEGKKNKKRKMISWDLLIAEN
jgi:hypothetical protein